MGKQAAQRARIGAGFNHGGQDAQPIAGLTDEIPQVIVIRQIIGQPGKSPNRVEAGAFERHGGSEGIRGLFDLAANHDLGGKRRVDHERFQQGRQGPSGAAAIHTGDQPGFRLG